MAFAVVIPSKSAVNLVPCVQAIRAAGETCRIIVVDDGVDWPAAEKMMHPDLPEGVHQMWPDTFAHEGVKPFVFARNINLGILAAGEDDVILLNDDALLKTPQGFSLLASASRACPEYGIIAAACDTVGNPNQFRRAGGALRDEPRMVCFVCVYIPRRVIETVGLLDERYVDYGLDDDDYSFRVRAAGLKIGILDGCFVDHASLKSSYRTTAPGAGNFIANMRRFIEKWGHDNWGRDRAHSQFAHLWPEAK